MDTTQLDTTRIPPPPDGGHPIQTCPLAGRWQVEHYGPDGDLTGVYDFKNAITNQGKEYLLNCGFNGGTQIAASSWYMGLIDNAGSPTLAPGDKLGGHSGWNEFTGYSGNRPAWGQGSASGTQACTNATPASFTIGSSGTLYGLIICSVATGGTGTDILWSTAPFTTPVSVGVGDVMKATYTLAT
jgi:hypothetical protein